MMYVTLDVILSYGKPEITEKEQNKMMDLTSFQLVRLHRLISDMWPGGSIEYTVNNCWSYRKGWASAIIIKSTLTSLLDSEDVK